MTRPVMVVSDMLITSRRGENSPQLQAGVRDASGASTPLRDNAEPSASFVYGDAQDHDGADAYLGNGALIRRVAPDVIEIRTSLTGFPPLYCHRTADTVTIAPTAQALARESAAAFELHQRGLAEWIRIGVPIQHRTLFAGVELLPAGVTIQVRGNAELRQVGAWEPSDEDPYPDQASYIRDQVRALGEAVQRMDTSLTFLSLTAGLDTRAVLSMLVRADRRLPAVTISGERDSLDARVARQLCKALGFEHHVVRPDARYYADIEPLTRETVRLSGGMAGIEQALELYTYRPGHGVRAARLTGNLGNQIGRSGTEGVGMRGLSSEWFQPHVARAIDTLPATHWHAQVASGATLNARELVQRESLFASLGNATLGSALALQQTPYADRTIINNKMREPQHEADERGVRARDLMHRFVGEPATRSFQRRAIVDVGGAASHIPINWGSVPTGGVSPMAVLRGLGAGVDAVLAKESGALRHFRAVRSLLGVRGLSGFRSEPIWRHAHVSAFMLDTIRDAVASEHPFFERTAVQRIVDARTPEGMTVAMQLLTLELARQEFSLTRLADDTRHTHQRP